MQRLKNKIIAINRAPERQDKPWGGGNALLSNLVKALEAQGAILTYEPILNADYCILYDIRGSEGWFDFYRGKHTKILLRVGDLGTHGKPQIAGLLAKYVDQPDLFVFPSKWAYGMAEHMICKVNEVDKLGEGFHKRCLVINNTPDSRFFTRDPVRIVTHHWSDNPKKGAAFYEELQSKIAEWKFHFTFIGRPCFSPNEFVNVVPPQPKDKLKELLKQHDWYLTASQEEAGANHVLEAMACNLPVLYHRGGGSIPEYCKGKGIMFDEIDELRPLLDHKYYPEIHKVCLDYIYALETA